MSLEERVLAKFNIAYRVKGNRAWALCPYHDDAHSSWMMRLRGERRGQHHCFSCKEGGVLADLVMHLRGYGTREAAQEWLDALRTDEDRVAAAPLAASIRMERAPAVRPGFRYPRDVDEGPLEEWISPARRYAVEKRHLTAEQVARWGIGYATDGRLAGRLVIFVRDARGRAAGYMARTFVDDETRYLYPDMKKERPDLDVLFGEQHWQRARGERSEVIVCEGALNALAVERAAADRPCFVAALGGSDLRPAHALKIASFERVVLLTDPDKAGARVALDLEAAFVRHAGVVRPKLPPGIDADDLDPGALRRIVWERA